MGATGSNPVDFYDLRSLSIEGRYETLLVRLYKLDCKNNADEDNNDTVLILDEQ
ncbi:hypothetical protein IFO70_35105 [Phormidium tenue FACHB-886]|nr:hypothetical protein [Phormidium tenue FACHB-886]